MASSGRRPRVRLRALLVVLIVVLPLGVYLWGRNSSAFAVQRIELTGARRVSAAKAAKTLRTHFLGRNLFGVRAAQVAAALRSFPYFAHVEIDRDFPNTLHVRIVEYRPAAVLFSAGHWYVVSREGRVLLRLPGVVAPPSARGEAGAAGQGSADAGQAGAGSGAAQTAADSGGGTGAAAGAAPGGTSAGGGTGSALTAAAGDSTTSAAAAADSTGAASDVAANEASALAASLSSASLGASGHTPSLLAGDLTAAVLSAAAPPRQADRLPVLVTKEKVKVGETVADRSVHDALAVLAALPAGLRARALLVTVAPVGIDVELRNGVTFALGDARDLGNKVLALRAVLAAYRRHHLRATWIDVSVPNRPLGTPVIVTRGARLQTAHPTPKASTTPKASATPKSSATPNSSPTPKSSPSARSTKTPGTAKAGAATTANGSPDEEADASPSPRTSRTAASP